MNILEPACLLRPFTMQARPVTVSLAVVLLTSCVTSATLRSDEDRALYDRCDRMAKFDAKAYAPSNGSGGGGHVGNVPPTRDACRFRPRERRALQWASRRASHDTTSRV